MAPRARPLAGGLGGLFLGALVAVDLQQFGIRPLDTTGIIGLPLAGVLVGLAWGYLGPLGRRSRARRRAATWTGTSLILVGVGATAALLVAGPVGRLPGTDLPFSRVTAIPPREVPENELTIPNLCPEGTTGGSRRAVLTDGITIFGSLDITAWAKYQAGLGRVEHLQRRRVSLGGKPASVWVATIYWGRQSSPSVPSGREAKVCGRYMLGAPGVRVEGWVTTGPFGSGYTLDTGGEELATILQRGGWYYFGMMTKWKSQNCTEWEMNGAGAYCRGSRALAERFEPYHRDIGRFADGGRVQIRRSDFGWIGAMSLKEEQISE